MKRCFVRRWPVQFLSAVFVVSSLVAGSFAELGATQVRFFRSNDRDAVRQGQLEGVGVNSLGNLTLTTAIEQLAAVDEPYVFSAAVRGDGWVVGTGNQGSVLSIAKDGTVSELFRTDEPDLFAITVSPDGAVFAGSSPNGKVYRFADGAAEVFFDPGEIYIWDLAFGSDGDLLVATGTDGKLYRVSPNGEGRVVTDSHDTHLRSLLPRRGGDVLIGTAPNGLILQIDSDGQTRTLHDSPLPEVVAFSCNDDDCFAALLDSEASLVPSTESNGGDNDDEEESDDKSGGSVTVKVEEDSNGSQRPRLRSAVVRVDASGGVRLLKSFETETVYDILWSNGRLWVATGQDGELFTLEESELTLERSVDDRQIVALLPGQDGLSFVTTNAGALYRSVRGAARTGTYTSPALDTEQVARFGTFHWRGDAAPGSELEFRFRSGMSSEPDDTWSDWSSAAGGREIGLGSVPAARYIQWQAEMSSSDERSPEIRETTLSFRQKNQPPRVAKLEVLEPGEILVASNFNPAQQVYEPVHPNRDGIFTSLTPGRDRSERRPKKLWKKGFRTLRWEAEDPNGDKLEYGLEFTLDGGGRSADGRSGDGDDWLPMVAELKESSYTFDSGVLADGVYRFRLLVGDGMSNERSEALSTTEVSPPVVVDHTVPRLDSVDHKGGGLTVQVSDALSPLIRVEVSVDAGEWQTVIPSDGMIDGLRETLTIDLPDEARLVLLRVGDAAWNDVTYNLLAE